MRVRKVHKALIPWCHDAPNSSICGITNAELSSIDKHVTCKKCLKMIHTCDKLNLFPDAPEVCCAAGCSGLVVFGICSRCQHDYRDSGK